MVERKLKRREVQVQAHIHLLLHPNPQNTVVICFGTGSTAGAISEHPVKEIIAVDTERGAFEFAGTVASV